MSLEVDKFKVFLDKAYCLPAPPTIPDLEHVRKQADLTSNVGSYVRGYEDGSVAGQRLLIDLIRKYVDENRTNQDQIWS